MTIRGSQVYISHRTRAGLRAAALVLGLDSPDAAAEKILSEHLEAMPAVADRLHMEDEMRDRLEKEWRSKHGI